MSPRTDDIRIHSIVPLTQPSLLMHELPLLEEDSAVVYEARREIEAILDEKDDRILVIVGPCSIHDPKSALEYASHLTKLAKRYEKELLIVMRTYFEKPRTTIGWKGLINDPDLDGTCDINKGLHIARELLLAINHMGLPVAVEYLDNITPQYIADLVSWGCIGARTAESQVHRQLASGLSCPIGIKNSTDGSIKIALDAVESAETEHQFLSVTKDGVVAIVHTKGNKYCHVILRGSNDGPNYSKEHVEKIEKDLSQREKRSKIMIDCSHGNSQKDHKKQIDVCKDVCNQISHGSKSIFAIMLESHLVEGAQKICKKEDLVYGKSVTDACISLGDTCLLLDEIAQSVVEKRKKNYA